MISGRGSNLRALIASEVRSAIRVVISNRVEAAGLEAAHDAGIETLVIPHGDFARREAYDHALVEALRARGVALVCLAGFMRLLGPTFCAAFPSAILNIHPSLLPAFAGLHTHRRALEAGVKLHGCTVHVVTPELDGGPIVVQAAVPVLAGDTEASLAARVLAAEHRIYPQAVRWFLEDRVVFASDAVVQVRGSGVSSDSMIAPREPN